MSGRADYQDDGCLSTYSQGEAGETCSGALNVLPYTFTTAPTAPTPSSAPTQGPTFNPNAIFGVVSGSEFCATSNGGACIGDTEGNYGNNERCIVQVLTESVIRVVDFQLEAGFDFLDICDGVTCNTYSNENGPNGVTVLPGQEIRFSSDHSVTMVGWLLCDNSSATAGDGTGDRIEEGAAFSVIDGSETCTTTDSAFCVQDTWGNYSESESCSIAVLRDVPALAIPTFALEQNYDFFYVCPVGHTGTDTSSCLNFTGTGDGLQHISLVAGQVLRFRSDSSVNGIGFSVCTIQDSNGEDRVPPTIPAQCLDSGCRRGNRWVLPRPNL